MMTTKGANMEKVDMRLFALHEHFDKHDFIPIAKGNRVAYCSGCGVFVRNAWPKSPLIQALTAGSFYTAQTLDPRDIGEADGAGPVYSLETMLAHFGVVEADNMRRLGLWLKVQGLHRVNPYLADLVMRAIACGK